MDVIDEAFIKSALKSRKSFIEGAYHHSSVMLLIFKTDRGCELLFCKRALSLSRQPGDICFPGGRREDGESPIETAYREVKEELGIPGRKIRVIKKLDYVVLSGGAIITPYAGICSGIAPEGIKFSRDEVDGIFTVPLDFFMDIEPEIHYIRYEQVFEKDFPFELIHAGRDYQFNMPRNKLLFYNYEGKIIWGITARILYSFIRRLKSGVKN